MKKKIVLGLTPLVLAAVMMTSAPTPALAEVEDVETYATDESDSAADTPFIREFHSGRRDGDFKDGGLRPFAGFGAFGDEKLPDLPSIGGSLPDFDIGGVSDEFFAAYTTQLNARFERYVAESIVTRAEADAAIAYLTIAAEEFKNGVVGEFDDLARDIRDKAQNGDLAGLHDVLKRRGKNFADEGEGDGGGAAVPRDDGFHSSKFAFGDMNALVDKGVLTAEQIEKMYASDKKDAQRAYIQSRTDALAPLVENGTLTEEQAKAVAEFLYGEK